MRRCTSLTAKPLWRVCIESSLNLIVPVSISGFFYLRVIQTLWNQENRVERNRALCICFISSWFLWVLLWTPKLILGFMQLGLKPIDYSTGRLGNTVLAYLVPSQTSIQILYSQLNPIIFIVLIRKIHDYHMNLWTLLKKILLLKKKKETEGTNAKQQSATQCEEFGYKYIRKSNDPNLLINVLVFTSAFLAFSLLTTAAVNTMSWNSSGKGLDFFSNKSSEEKQLVKTSKRTFTNVRGLTWVYYYPINKFRDTH